MTRLPRTSVETVAFTDHHVAVYLGRDALGEVLIGRTIRAVDTAGNELGTFRNREEATKAIIRAAKRAERPG
jgi:hypothetical protein